MTDAAWSQINDDEETWPEEGQVCLFVLSVRGRHERHFYRFTQERRKLLANAFWRPLNDSDTPPGLNP